MLPLCSFVSQQVERVLEKTDRLRSDMFGELLQAANTIGDLRNCPVYKSIFLKLVAFVHTIFLECQVRWTEMMGYLMQTLVLWQQSELFHRNHLRHDWIPIWTRLVFWTGLSLISYHLISLIPETDETELSVYITEVEASVFNLWALQKITCLWWVHCYCMFHTIWSVLLIA